MPPISLSEGLLNITYHNSLACVRRPSPESCACTNTVFTDRDITRGSKVIPEEHEKRRAIFWELLNMDCRMVSLSLKNLLKIGLK